MNPRNPGDEKYATLEEAVQDIKQHDYELADASTNRKDRNCVKCGSNIKKGESFYHQFIYPYINVKIWKMCTACFHIIKGNPIN